MCLMVAFGIAFCVYRNSNLYNHNPKPSFNSPAAVEYSPQPVRRVVRAQPEFIEKDAKQEAEDILEVSLPVESADLEAQPLHKCNTTANTTASQMQHKMEQR